MISPRTSGPSWLHAWRSSSSSRCVSPVALGTRPRGCSLCSERAGRQEPASVRARCLQSLLWEPRGPGSPGPREDRSLEDLVSKRGWGRGTRAGGRTGPEDWTGRRRGRRETPPRSPLSVPHCLRVAGNVPCGQGQYRPEGSQETPAPGQQPGDLASRGPSLGREMS